MPSAVSSFPVHYLSVTSPNTYWYRAVLFPHCMGEVRVTAGVTAPLIVEQNTDQGLSDWAVCTLKPHTVIEPQNSHLGQ